MPSPTPPVAAPDFPPSTPSASGSDYAPTPSPEPKPRIPKKRGSSDSGTPRKKSTPTSGKSRGRFTAHRYEVGQASGGRKTGLWTKREIRQLFNAVIVIPNTISWANVAESVDGRDKLSCSNKWRYDLLPKIQAFIDSLGD